MPPAELDTPPGAVFFGCAGTQLTGQERAFFNDVRPSGFILFARNIDTPAQVQGLCRELRALTPVSPAPILIDQEGGRVSRLRPPHWLQHPPAGDIGKLFTRDEAAGARAAWLTGRIIGEELRQAGITVDCLPVLDIARPQTSAVIGDRSFGSCPDQVATLGQAAAQGIQNAGIVPVIKHMPGHGRGEVDSHKHLPIVDAPLADLLEDFAPFIAMNEAPMAMTAHIRFTALDPDNCATQSSVVIETIIRQLIGFDGFLMSDDLSMHALGGDFQSRTRATLNAGCDIVLHCNGDMMEMEAVAGAAGRLRPESLARLTRAMATANTADALTTGQLEGLVAERQALLGGNMEPAIS